MKIELIIAQLILWLNIGVYVYAQGLTKAQLKYCSKNISTLCADKSLSDIGWEKIRPTIGNNKIILLGEFTHGSGGIFRIRTDFLKYLHEQLGYNTVLFESGIGELIVPELNKKSISAAQMTYGFFGGWRTKESIEMMEYIKSSKIRIAGFDVQRTGSSFKSLLKELIQNHKLESPGFSDLEERYWELQKKLTDRKVKYDSIELPVSQLISDYRNLHQAQKKISGLATEKELLIFRTLENRIHYLSYMLEFSKDKNWNKRWAARDSMMASNIVWLLKILFKNEKAIIVGHNYHIAKYNESEDVMGEYLAKTYPNEMYSIGIVAGSGKYLDNSNNSMTLVPPDSVWPDIKQIIGVMQGHLGFFRMPGQNSDSEWLYHSIVVKDSFIDLSGSDTMILPKSFDGLILIKEVSVADDK